MTYTGSSVVDYLKSVSKDSSFQSRADLANYYGIKNYTGSSDQNSLLLTKLKEKEPPKTLKQGFITNTVVDAAKNLLTTGKTGITADSLYEYKVPTVKIAEVATKSLSEAPGYKAPTGSAYSLDTLIKSGEKINTTSKYVQDPNNANASIPNPYYKTESKTPEQVAAEILKGSSDKSVTESVKETIKDTVKESTGGSTSETTEESNLKMDEKPAQRERTLVLPAEQMAFDKWAASNNIQDPFRDQTTDWEKLYKENKTLADAGTLSITQSLIDKYRLTPVTASTTTTTTPITSIKYIDEFPKSSDEMEQWVAQGRVWDPVAGKWRERSVIIQEETNDLMKTVLEEVDKRLAAGSTLTTDQQTIYDNARAALDLYSKESTSSTTTQKTTESTTDNKTEEAEIKELENLNQLTDAQLSVYTKQELRDAGMNILQAFKTYKAYADDAASKLKANPSVELDPIQKAVYNYYY